MSDLGRNNCCQTLEEPRKFLSHRKPWRTMVPTPIIDMESLRSRKEKVLAQGHTIGTRTQSCICPHSPQLPTSRHPEPGGGAPALTRVMTEERRSVLGGVEPAA